jgi:anti-sigma-K factor RskA
MREHDIERDPPSADVQAGEYVLGVLDAAAMLEARRRASRDPAFARLVEEWSTRLAPLNDELGDEDVPAHVWPKVRTRLGWSPVGEGRDAAGPKLAFWRGAAAAGFAMAAALAVVAVMRPGLQPQATPAPIATTPAPAPVPTDVARDGLQDLPLLPVTKLVQDDGSPAFLASIDRDTGGMWLVPMPGVTKTGDRLPVLWLIPEGGRPRVLGFVNVKHSHWVDVPKDLRGELAGGSTLAITLEPASKEPPSAPSSTPVAAGGITL